MVRLKIDWEQAYLEGRYKNWDFGGPSSELVATIAVNGLAKPGQTALDIGCGGGWESIFLAQCGYQVTGVDLSRNALEIAVERAKEAGVQVHFCQGDALNLPVEDCSVDFANDRGCFHVIPEEQREAYAKEVHRVLKPGGILLLRGCGRFDDDLKKQMAQADGQAGRDVSFHVVNQEVIDRFFGSDRFDRGPVLPLRMMGKAHGIPGNMVVLRKR